MKIRKDFVTNSSSSSYICEICNYVESGWDLGLAEAEMVECVKGHEFCENHLKKGFNETFYEHSEKEIKLIDPSEKEKLYEEQKKDNETIEECITRLSKDKDFLKEYFDISDFRYYLPSEYCPICNHEVILDREVVDFAMNHFDVDKKELDLIVRTYLLNKM